MTPPWLTPHLREFWPLDDQDILRATVVGEAEGERPAGMFAVSCVIRNRLLLGWLHAESYREICLAPHQFSCWWSDFGLRAKAMRAALADPGHYLEADDAARQCLSGLPDITAMATHYFNPHVVLPAWARGLVRTCRVGRHDYYGMGVS